MCMNGACKGAFVLIQKECPSVQCFVCPAHGMDGFLKNVGSSAESIRMQVNVMGISSISVNVMVISSISAASQMECNEPFFRDYFDNTGKLVTWISRKQKPFARFKMISQVIKVKKIRISGTSGLGSNPSNREIASFQFSSKTKKKIYLTRPKVSKESLTS